MAPKKSTTTKKPTATATAAKKIKKSKDEASSPNGTDSPDAALTMTHIPVAQQPMDVDLDPDDQNARAEFNVTSSASSFKDFVRGTWVHVLLVGLAQTQYVVWDWRWASSKFSDYDYGADAETRQLLPLGNYNAGMMTEAMPPAKRDWCKAVQAIFKGAKVATDCNAKIQRICFTFAKKVVLSAADCKDLLAAFNTYLLTSSFETDGVHMPRSDAPGEGIIQIRKGRYNGKIQKQQIVSCFVGFPNPPPVDDVYVVKPVKVVMQQDKQRGGKDSDDSEPGWRNQKKAADGRKVQ